VKIAGRYSSIPLTFFIRRLSGLEEIRLLYLLRDLIDIRIAKPLLPLLGVIAPAQFRLLEEADHTDDPKMLAERF
jgi:hypothetical protein